jgi:hypothetical protein
MAWSSNDQYKIVADKIVSSDPDMVISVAGGLYINDTSEASKVATMADVGNAGPTIIPLPDFLTYEEGRSHLPRLNQNFGWDSEGLWFGNEVSTGPSYPVFTDFTISATDAVTVEFNVDIQDECSDIGLCIYLDGDTPEWEFGTNATRIAAQFDCESPQLVGRITAYEGERTNISSAGMYHIRFTYNPVAEDSVRFEYFEGTTTETLVSELVLGEALGEGSYRIGFASDNSARTYISDLSIIINEEDAVYTDTLQNGTSIGASAEIADFVFDIFEDEGTYSRMTIANHDMVIRTTRDDGQDADIGIESADDLWLTALNDDIRLRAGDDVEIITNTNGDTEHRWEFTNGGVLTKDGNLVLDALYNTDVKAKLTLDPSDGQAMLKAYSSNNTATFTTGDWDTATWITLNPGLSQLTLTDAPGILSFMDNTGYQVDNLKISINDGIYGAYAGASSGDGAITFGILDVIPEGEVTVTEVRFQYAFSSKVDIDFDENELVIRTEDEMTTFIDSDDTLTLRSRTNQTRVQANGDVTFTANYGEDTEPQWKMRQDGRFELPTEGYIKGLFGNSSDGNNYDTIEVIPDFGRYDDGGNQYLVIEPTEPPNPEAPGHIHIRAGGTIDESTADLILGGERNQVTVSDTEKAVGIRTAFRAQNTYTNISDEAGTQFIALSTSDIAEGYTVDVDGTVYVVDSVTSFDEGLVAVTANDAVFQAEGMYTFVNASTNFENQWTFGSDGVFSGPSMGGVRVPSIANAGPDVDLYINAYGANADLRLEADQNVVVTTEYGDIVLNADGGEFIGNSSSPENRIATRGEVGIETSFIVAGGTTGDQPEFDGDPLFTGSYIRNYGGLVHFRIDVNMDNITDFGTGQYYVDLPFPAKYNYHFRDACLHDNSGTVRQYALSGHVYANQSRVTLWFTATSGQDEAFDYNSPALLTVADNFHIAGTYIAD